MLAHLADEDALIEAFRSGEDIHDRTAMKVFGPNSGLDPHELRRRAKIVNYALLYGKTAFTLAKDIGVTKEAAQEFIDAYFAGFPQGPRLHRPHARSGARERCREDPVRPPQARAEPEQPQRPDQIAAERETVNMPIQGTAADILKKAMIDLHAELPNRGFATRA